jgi:hypothetical protein
VVPTIDFRLLYVLVILGHHHRRILSFGVTSHPTAEWIARQITDAFPWTEAPRHLIRDRDAVYGQVVTRRLKSMGIRDRPTAPRSPWQTDVIVKRFLERPRLCSLCARATAWRRAGLEVRALPRSLYGRSSVAAPVRALGPRGFQPATKRS